MYTGPNYFPTKKLASQRTDNFPLSSLPLAHFLFLTLSFSLSSLSLSPFSLSLSLSLTPSLSYSFPLFLSFSLSLSLFLSLSLALTHTSSHVLSLSLSFSPVSWQNTQWQCEPEPATLRPRYRSQAKLADVVTVPACGQHVGRYSARTLKRVAEFRAPIAVASCQNILNTTRGGEWEGNGGKEEGRRKRLGRPQRRTREVGRKGKKGWGKATIKAQRKDEQETL